MSQRDAALMRRALRDSGNKSPEAYAYHHGERIFYYSARTIRRWLAGHPMPPEVRKNLKSYLTSTTE